jgi:fatty-acyl-CoA synthase
MAADLVARASATALRLNELDLARRSVIGVCRYSGPGLYADWLGCLWSGRIPTMMAPPSPRMEPTKYAEGLAGIVKGLGLKAMLVDSDMPSGIADTAAGLAHLLRGDDEARAPAVSAAAASAGDVAVIQHSSGTTGQQKAIALTTAQILAHQSDYAQRLALTADDRVISWLPLYHDMGFVAAFLQPLLAGIEIIELSPFEWANDPAMLLRAIDAWRPTLCWMPNFAFKLLSEPRSLRSAGTPDLSSVRAWVNCSEPVMAASIDSFLAALGPFGVDPASVTSSYAMAENVFAVTQSEPGEGRRLRVDRLALERDGVARPAIQDAEGATLVSNGRPLPMTEIQVRGADGVVLGDRQVGEIHLRGGYRFSGYHGRPDLTAQAIDRDGWYATGDLGFMDEGEVYVTGRKKDLIILRGRNYAAHDIECEVAGVPGVKAGRVVAFSLSDEGIGTERLVILAEAEPGARPDGVLALEVRKCVAQSFDTTASDVRIVPPRWLVKATSGKLARGDNRAKYLATWGA